MHTAVSFQRVLVIAGLAVAAGCATSPDDQSGQLPVAVPETFDAREDIESFERMEWLWDFDDEMLRGLVAETFTNNYNLQAAVARLEAAVAGQRVVAAAQYPSLNGTAGASRRNTFIEQPGGGVQEDVFDNYSLGLNLLWEIDVWGKVKNRTQAAIADVEAAQADYDAFRFSLAATTVKSWFNAVEAELQLQLANETARVFAQNLRVVEGSYQRGLPDRALDVRLTRANVHAANSTVELRQRLRDASGRSLESLLGRYPADAIEVSTNLPSLTLDIPPGLPSELLNRRPDIVAAERRLAAGLERAKVARKELLPTISLTSSAGTSSGDLEDLLDFERILWSVAGNLSQPIFQGGRLIAGIDLADANSRALLADYAQTVLNAFQEVETFLAAEDYLRREELALAQAAVESVAAQELAWQQYQRGLVDIITVLESQRRAFNARSAHLNVINDRLSNRINLYLALGGDFRGPETQPEEIALNQ